MDIALCSFNRAEQLLKYAGANRPLYHIRNGVLDIMKPDKLPIGGFQHAGRRVFTEHTLMLEQGSTFYLFTDGYPDQFGGDKNKKLMVAKFKELLQDIQALDMPSQKEHLENFISSWKGDNDQVDDILVIGIRV
jgi:serine phosphatase RsbU (regulator of sigma subunit)